MDEEEPKNWKEGRRLRAYELSQEGWSQKDIGTALGVSKGAVSKWMKRARTGGKAALRHQPPPGAKSKLTADQLAQLPGLLAKGAEAYGYRGAVWTRARVQQVIQDVFKVSYHVDHMSYLLAKIGWTRQKPRRRASQRNQAAIKDWETNQSTLEKEAEEAGQTLVFGDEAGFSLLSGVVATYAPIGQTPVLHVPLSYDRLSVMGALSNTGELLTSTQDHPVKAPDLVRFLKQVLTHIPGDILFLWDGLPAHRSQPVKDFLATPAAKRLTLLQLPAYAPELNPQEGIWRYLKYVELANVCCHNLSELRLELRRAIQRVRSHLDVLFGCLRQVHYSVANSITG
jgi:transposase